MFGSNAIHGKKTFAQLGSDQLIVTSMFATLQGEGPLSGQRSVFLRLAHCNLACSFCDTYFDRGEVYSFTNLLDALIDSIIKWIAKIDPTYDTRTLYSDQGEPNRAVAVEWNLIITGGEPLLQQNVFDFINYIYNERRRKYIPVFKTIQIESNGIPSAERLHPDAMLIVSPKCVEKDGVALHHIKPHPKTLARTNALKFVLTADQSSGYSSVPQWAHDWRNHTELPIYVSPLNVYLREPQAALMAAKSNKEISIEERSETLEKISFWEEGLLNMEENRKNHEYAALMAMKHNYVLSLQTHLLASLP